MAKTGFIYCVLIQVLLITVYGQSTKVPINCANHSVTLGEPLLLTCIVTCDGCNTQEYTWSKLGKPEFNNCSDGEKRVIPIGNFHIFQCRIPRASEEHNGTFQLFVQTKTGETKMTFHLKTEPNPPSPTTPVASPSTRVAIISAAPPEKMKGEENGRSYNVVVPVMLMLCLLICAIAVVLLRTKKGNIMSISALLTHKRTTETEIV